jgi:hypothetical protein
MKELFLYYLKSILPFIFFVKIQGKFNRQINPHKEVYNTLTGGKYDKGMSRI